VTTHRPIKVAHVLFHFGIGGLENGLVNLINGLDPARYRHVLVCLTDFDEVYARRLRTDNYELHALHKQPGHDPAVWWRMWKLLRELRPDVLHTRNFVALEMQLIGLLAGVRGRVHGEHGWDVQDLDGTVRKYQVARRVIGSVVNRFIALSQDLERYLLGPVGLPRAEVVQRYNGVDCARFHPLPAPPEPIVIGTVGRMKAVKNQPLLCHAFVTLLARRPDLAERTRLRLVGSGPLRAECEGIVGAAGLAHAVDFIGDSDRVEEEMPHMHVFVLPSRAEGISNTILEAMASGLPVIATAVGGNPELVADGSTGCLVPSDDVDALAAAIETYVDEPERRRQHGEQGRRLALGQFSLSGMIAAYDDIYTELAR